MGWIKDPQDIPEDQIAIVSVAITNPEGKVLVVRRNKDEETRPGQWECPGGHKEGDETIEETAKREIKEELGLKVKVDTSKLEFFTLRDGRYGVLVKADVESDRTKFRLTGHDKYTWIDPEEADSLSPTPPDFAQSLQSLLRVRGNKMVAARNKRYAAPTILQLPNRKQPKTVRQAAVEKEDPEITARKMQAMYPVLGIPAWEAMFVFQNGSGEAHNAPDWSNNEQESGVPSTFPEITHVVKGSFGVNDYDEPLYRTVMETLRSHGVADGCECSFPLKDQGSIALQNPRERPFFMDILHGAGLIAAPMRKSNQIFVTVPRIAKIVKTKGGYKVVSEKGKNLSKPYKTRKEAQDRLNEIEMFKHMDKNKKKKAASGQRMANGLALTVKPAPGQAKTQPQSPQTQTPGANPVDKAIQGVAPPGTTVQTDPANPAQKVVNYNPPPGTSPADAAKALEDINKAVNTSFGGTQISASVRAGMRRAKQELQELYAPRKWFRGASLVPYKGRVAIALHADTDEISDSEVLPDAHGGMAVVLMVMKEKPELRPIIRN